MPECFTDSDQMCGLSLPRFQLLKLFVFFHRIHLLQRFLNKKCILLREIAYFSATPSFAQSESSSTMLPNIDFALTSDDYQALYKTVRSVSLLGGDSTQC